MSLFNPDPLKISRIIQIIFIILLGAVVVFIIFIGLSSCAYHEVLTECSEKDLVVTGYSKNKKKYLVQTSCGNWHEPIKIEGDTLNVGAWLIMKNEYRKTMERY
jgi:hypothetical protein